MKTKTKSEKQYLLQSDLSLAGKGQVHTKKEWKRIYGYEIGLVPGAMFIEQKTAINKFIKEIHQGTINPKRIYTDGIEQVAICTTEEWANRMVKAVNMHKRLVEELERAKRRIVFLEGFTEGKADPTDLKGINELLKQAEDK